MDPSFPGPGSAYMNKEGPANPHFHVPNGKLLYNEKRNAYFPYIYEIPTHALVHSPQHFQKILIHIVDTAEKARTARAIYQKSLLVPLGPNDLMANYGEYVPVMFTLISVYENLHQGYSKWSLAQFCLPDLCGWMGTIGNRTT